MSSWPALFAAALAMWLVLRGPAAKKPSWVQRACRVAVAFFAYSGFLYLLKWDPFWKLLSVCNGPQKLDKKKTFLRWWAALKMKESQCPERVRVIHPA